METNEAVTEAMLSAAESGMIPCVNARLSMDSEDDLTREVLTDEERGEQEASELAWRSFYTEASTQKSAPVIGEKGSELHTLSTMDVTMVDATDRLFELESNIPAIYTLGDSRRIGRSQSGEETMAAVASEFSLNTEQMRAFCIVAQHSLQPSPSQLQMYLMGSGAPVLVYSNAMKDALNVSLALAYADQHKLPFQWYHAADFHKGQSILDLRLREYLSTLDSGRTNQRMGKLPLVRGMPVMIAHNYGVDVGVANGTVGTLNQIRYMKNDCGEVPVFTEDVKMEFVHPFSGRRS
ncbi:hypothetical protein ONZ45_g6853 [Pleurotus djamor]|nr:hypothetical protein ONZ45_g6853 [Pleurotus djamor]